MICFRDKTHCGYKKCSKWDDCDRAFTEETQREADEWWREGFGDGDPIIMFFAGIPECFENKGEINE